MIFEILAQLPFAEETGRISALFKQVHDGRFIKGDPPGPALFHVLRALLAEDGREILIVHPDAALLMATGLQSRPRGRAHRAVAVEAGEAHALGRKAVQVRGFDLRAALGSERL
jgi:hypothetical protein